MVTSRCPDREALEQLALGRMAPEEVERLAQHCENCGRCIRILQELQPEDVLVETVRAGGTAIDAPLPDRVRALMQSLRGWYARGEPHTWSKASDSSFPSAQPAEEQGSVLAESCDFLAPPEAPDELGRLGGYRVLRTLGAGGMGIVFLAEDLELKRQVALKVMKPLLAASASARQRFLREARAMAAVENDHIVHINQIGQAGGIPFLAMPYLQGETLESRLEREGRLPVADVIRIGSEIATGLAAAHARGLIHRDVKPPNIWLEGERGRVKLLDFGLARAFADETQLTQCGAIAGTPAYMAPEQATGDPIDQRCDLFSLGCVLYRMCTGQAPFAGDSTLQILRAVESCHPPAPAEKCADVHPALSALVMRLLAKNPADRPQSAAEVIEALQALPAIMSAESPSAAARSERPAIPAATGARRRVPIFVAALLLAFLPLAWLCGGAVFRVVTNKGELVIETADPDLEVTIRNDRAHVYDKVKDRRFLLTPGDYEVEVREEGENGLRFLTKKFTITRGGRETFHARLASLPQPPASDEARQSARVEEKSGQSPQAPEIANTAPSVAPGENPPVAPAEGFVSLFNGEDLTGWEKHAEQPRGWRVEDGLLTGRSETASYLFSQASDFEDFHLRAECRTNRLGNGGIFFRASSALDWEIGHGRKAPSGYEAQITHESPRPAYSLTGSLLRSPFTHPLTRVTRCDLKPDEWFTLEVIARGRQIIIKINGQETANVEDDVFERGHIALQVFSDPVTGSETQVEFRRIEIKRLTGSADPDRAMATWVLGVGGNIRLTCRGRESTAIKVSELPELPFIISSINLENRPIVDADLARLKDFRGVVLSLRSTPVSDAGLAHLAGLSNLLTLILDDTKITDAGFVHLKGLGLESIQISGENITDAALMQLSEISTLKRLSLDDTKVTDEGLLSLRTLPDLQVLALVSASITDDGLENLKGLNLSELWLQDTRITDAGLAHLKEMESLTFLRLGQTAITDAGLVHLKGLKRLASLGLPDRVTDAGLAHLRELTELSELSLTYADITDASLIQLAELPKLAVLGLRGTLVTDNGLKHLHRLKTLKEINLIETKVSEAGIQELKAAIPACVILR